MVAAVADALLAVGALPSRTRLLREPPSETGPRWGRDAATRWSQRVHRRLATTGGPKAQLSVGAVLPLKDAVVVIEYLAVNGDAVTIHLYVAPYGQGEYWPVNVPNVEVDATDESGAHYETIPATHWGGRNGGEANGDLLMWPPVPPDVRRLRFRVSTFWAAAWADIDLPDR